VAAPEWAAAFEESAGRTLALYQTPGMAVAVARDGVMAYCRGFGFRDRERGLPVGPRTLFGVGSVTKSFTCVAIMQLQERGLLSVHDPVQRYLPEFSTPDPAAARAMTLHHFMTHSSGLPPLPSLYPAMARSIAGDPAAPPQLAGGETRPIDTPADLMEAIAHGDFELLGPPGAQFSYSNDAYALLGTVIERVSGMSYADYLQRHILGPCGMTSTTLSPAAAAAAEDVATLYAVRQDADGAETVYAAPQWWDAPAMLAAGFLKSNVADLLRYLEIYRTGGLAGTERVLAAESVAAMCRPHVPVNPHAGYGYGLLVTPRYHGVTLVEHSGGLKGIAAQVCVVPERGLTGVALANVAGAPSGLLLLRALNGMLGLPLPTRRAEYPTAAAPADLGSYAGLYRSGEGARIEVSVEGDSLVFATEGKRLPARPVGEDAFVVTLREDETYARFLRRAGAVWAVAYGSRIVRRAAVAPAATAG
jgi:CubicO group peptidase (beta-lactamase class C family)